MRFTHIEQLCLLYSPGVFYWYIKCATVYYKKYSTKLIVCGRPKEISQFLNNTDFKKSDWSSQWVVFEWTFFIQKFTGFPADWWAVQAVIKAFLQSL